MEASVVGFLDSVSSTIFRLAAICFVLLNGAALAAFLLTRSRRLVDAWTLRLVTLDAILLGAGLGVPLLAGIAKLGVRALGSLSLAVFK